MNSEEEIWKDIPKYEGYYQASSLGRIRSLDRISMILGRPTKVIGRVIKVKHNKSNGYCVVILCVNGARKTHTVHRLVAMSWIPNNSGLGDVNHKNGDKHDNKPDNLEWCNRSQNHLHAYKTGLKVSRKGEDVFWKAKLTEAQVRSVFCDPRSASSIAASLGVTKSCITHIKSGISWRHLRLCAC